MPRLSEISSSKRTVKLSELNEPDPVFEQRIPETGNFIQQAIRAAQNPKRFIQEVDPTYSGPEALRRFGEGLGDIYGPPTEFANQASFGMLRPAVKKMTGLDLPEAHSIPGKAMQGVAATAGFIGGGPGRLSMKIGKKIFPKAAAKKNIPGFLARSLQRAAEGATSGALVPNDLENRASFAKAGAILGPTVGAAAEGIPAAAKGIKQLFSKKPAQDALQAIRTEAESLSYRAQEGVRNKADELLEAAKERFGKAFEIFSSSMRRKDLADTLRRSIDDLAAETEEIAGSDANTLGRFLDRINPAAETQSAGILDNYGREITRTIDHGEEILSKEFIQEQAKHIYNRLSARGRAIFTKFHLDKLDETIPGLREAKAELAPFYKLVKSIKPLKQSRIKEISTGDFSKISREEIARLQELERPVGTDYVNRAIKLGEESQAAENKLSKIIQRQRKVKNVGKGAVGVSGAYGVYQLLKNIADQD